MITDEEVYRIGHLTKTHGVNGEVNLHFTDDVFDRVDAEYLVFRLDGINVPFFMEEYRFRSDTTAIMKFEGVDTEEQARRLVGVEVYFPHALTPDEEPEAYSWAYFTGFRVVDEVHGELGTVEHVNDDTANVLFEIRRPDGRELLLPAHEEFVQEVNATDRTLTVRVPDGLLELAE